MLAENNVKLIGVMVEQFGEPFYRTVLREFINEQFFKGDIFVAEGKTAYAALDFKTMSFSQLFQSHLSGVYGSVWECMRVGSQLSGDSYQLGGCLVMEAGGGDEPLLHYIQQGPLDHLANADVLRALGISS